MRLTVLQLEATWNRVPTMLARVERQLEAGPATDVVLLAEAVLTGYASPALDFDLTPFAEALDGTTVTALSALAAKHRLTLVAPLILGEDKRVYNAMIGVDPSGVRFVYRKRHPWYPETWADPGPFPPPVLEIAGVRTTMLVCYDVQFAADAASELDAADLLLFPSAWVDEADTRPALLAELARRHHLWIANANWAAGDVVVPGQGGSCVLDAGGRMVARCDGGQARLDVGVDVFTAPEPRPR